MIRSQYCTPKLIAVPVNVAEVIVGDPDNEGEPDNEGLPDNEGVPDKEGVPVIL